MRLNSFVYSWLILLSICLLVPSKGIGQEVNETAIDSVFDLGTPQAAVRTHLHYLLPNIYFPRTSAEVIDGSRIRIEHRKDIAIQLKQIYDGEGYFVRISEIPNDSSYTDSLGQERYVVFPKYPEIYVERTKGGDWKYSKESAKAIPEIHRKIFPFGADDEEEETEEEEEPEITFSLESPYHTLVSHLYFLQPETFDPNLSAQSLYGKGHSLPQLKQLAIQLKQIYDGDGYYVYPEDAPDDPDYVDTVSGRQRYVVYDKYPDLYIEKRGDVWVYSKKTVRLIPEIHKKVFPFGTDKLLNILPKAGSQKVLGLHVWQYLALLLILGVSLLLYKLLDIIASFIIRKIPDAFRAERLANELIEPLSKPLSLLVVTLFVNRSLSVVQLPIAFGKYIHMLLHILAPIFGIIALYRLIDFLAKILTSLAGRTETAMDDQLVPLVTRILKFTVVILGSIFVLQNLNVNVTALLAGISIGGLAIALAAQDTVRNFIGSITIFVDRPFQVGDWIEAGSIVGTVEEVGVRSSRIRLADGTLASIPNGELANTTINNAGSARTYRRYATNLTLTYSTTPEQLVQFVEGVREIMNRHPKTRNEGNIAYFTDMSSSSLDVFIAMYLDNASFIDELKARHEVLLEIMKFAESMGVGFAFPSTSVYIESMPDKQ